MSLIYAVGDIHGSLDKLQRLIARCVEHADGRPMTLVFLGDYIDRGPQSSGVVGFLIDLQSQLGERVVVLMGNHEAMALAVIDGTSPARLWFAQGGAATLESYGVARPSELPREHVDWMRSLRLGRDYGRLIVHGHTPVTSGAPDLRSNRLNLDPGAVFSGPLTAAVFDDAQTKPV